MPRLDGPTGAHGATGMQGATGAAGPTGDVGPTGVYLLAKTDRNFAEASAAPSALKLSHMGVGWWFAIGALTTLALVGSGLIRRRIAQRER
jgi:hypothetical protein